MPGRIIHALPCLFALATSACAHAGAQAGSCDASFDEAEVAAVLDEQRAAWNEGNLDGFLAGYEESEALLFTSGGNIRQGYTETRDKYRARYGEARDTMGTLGFEVLDVRGLGACGDAAIVLGRWKLTNTPQAGSGVFSVILERQAKGWKIVHDHTSADPAQE